jgi:hypothetical protein
MVKETPSAMVPKGDLLILNSAGPNHAPAVAGVPKDALALFLNPGLAEAFKVVCSYTGLSLYRT